MCVPLVDSSHDRRGAPERQLGGEDDSEQEHVGFDDLRERRAVGLAQSVQLVTCHAPDLTETRVRTHTHTVSHTNTHPRYLSTG